MPFSPKATERPGEVKSRMRGYPESEVERAFLYRATTFQAKPCDSRFPNGARELNFI